MGLLAFACAAALIPLWKRWAAGRMVDIPNERSSHDAPTIRGGGTAIVAVSVAATALASAGILDSRRLTFLVAAAFVAIVSWIDDWRSLPPLVRLLAHTLAALAATLVCGPFRVLSLPSFGSIGIAPGTAVLLTTIWIVGLTNAFNFMDGIDGLASVQAMIAASGWFMLAKWHGDVFTAYTALFVGAATAGFLIYNWSPASIFMGDVGSAFLGFCFATMPLIDSGRRDTSAVVAVLLVFPFVFDALITFTRRLLRGERVWQPHREHLYQRLVVAGWSHAHVAILYGVLGIITAGTALLFDRRPQRGVDLAAIAEAIAIPGVVLLITRSATRRRTVSPLQ